VSRSFWGASNLLQQRDRRSLRAVATLCAGIFIFSFQDVVVKTVAGLYPVHEVITIRCVISIPIILAMLHWHGGIRSILSRRAGWLALRGAALMVSYTTYYLAFPVLPLASIIALYFTVPLFVTALAGPVLGERIGLNRWIATVVGFAGVLVMLRPASGFFEWAALLPVGSALGYAAAALMARRLGATDSAPVMAFYQNLLFLIGALAMAALLGQGGFAGDSQGSLAFLLRAWTLPSWRDLLLMAATGPIAAIGTVLLTQAYRMAEANLVASFEYSGLIWASLWGFAFWGEVPGLATLTGAALIIGAGLYMLYGARSAPVPAPEAEIGSERV
jgi:drug/metabolite transporter (DMT)-like permease